MFLLLVTLWLAILLVLDYRLLGFITRQKKGDVKVHEMFMKCS